MGSATFNLDCKDCPRLYKNLANLSKKYSEYWNKPVPSFGDEQPNILIVGLAPGLHGANATGRPFTGDFAGILLYETLYKFGLANKPTSIQNSDGLSLKGCRITNAVKCLPPQNKPNTDEIKNCNKYLYQEINQMKKKKIVIIALGKIAHDAVLRANQIKLSEYKFAHLAMYQISSKITLIDSYHCSRYNTQTKRLTATMFESVFELAMKCVR